MVNIKIYDVKEWTLATAFDLIWETLHAQYLKK